MGLGSGGIGGSSATDIPFSILASIYIPRFIQISTLNCKASKAMRVYLAKETNVLSLRRTLQNWSSQNTVDALDVASAWGVGWGDRLPMAGRTGMPM